MYCRLRTMCCKSSCRDSFVHTKNPTRHAEILKRQNVPNVIKRTITKTFIQLNRHNVPFMSHCIIVYYFCVIRNVFSRFEVPLGMRNVLSFLNTKIITGVCYAFALVDGGRVGWSHGYFWWQFVASMAWMLSFFALCHLCPYATIRSSN
jgi:hypothetical protein